MKKSKGELLSNTANVKNSKFVANNTLQIEYENGLKSIRLHNTDIVTFDKDKIILNSGGWRTNTTKERIGRFSPATIYSRNGLWYLTGNKLFYDNCVVNDKGELISKPLKNEAIENKVKKLKKQITKYCNLITKNNCIANNNLDWVQKHKNVLNEIEKNYLPHGSGIDAGCKIDLQKSNEQKIVITFGFHHLNENGYYSDWTEHNLICKPGFDCLNLHITGADKNSIKDYLYELFNTCLTEEIEFLPFQ